MCFRVGLKNVSPNSQQVTKDEFLGYTMPHKCRLVSWFHPHPSQTMVAILDDEHSIHCRYVAYVVHHIHRDIACEAMRWQTKQIGCNWNVVFGVFGDKFVHELINSNMVGQVLGGTAKPLPRRQKIDNREGRIHPMLLERNSFFSCRFGRFEN